MKSYLKICALSILLISFFSSCETDGTGTGGGPILADEISLDLSNEAGFVSSGATIKPGETFAVRLVAEKGEDDLQAITITENGATLDISRFEASNTTVGANPFTIDASEVSSFTKDITITTPVENGEYIYTFTLRDVAGNTDSKTVTITVDPTTPLISLELSSEAGFVSSAATVDIGGTFAVRLVAKKGEDDLQAITITENGSNLDISRFQASNTTVGANPFTIDATEFASFTKDITITTPIVAGEYMYTFILRDIGGNTDSETVTITVNTIPPSVSFMGSGMVMASLGTLINVPIMASAGSSPLNQIAVYLGTDLVPANELFYGEITQEFPTNPALLPDSDKQMMDRSIFIRANAIGESIYTIEITDEDGETATVDVTVSTGTTVEMIEGALLNSSGPMGTGGLDLDTGASIGSNDSDAEIRDEGIDTDEPMDANWLQQIAGVDGAEIRAMIKGEAGLGENYSFAGVDTKEQIEALWSNGTNATLSTNTSGNVQSSRLVGGENFIVFDNGTYYLISIREVRVTPGDNNDQYVIDIKK